MASHKPEFSKVAVYMVANYVTEVQKVTLHPVVKVMGNYLMPWRKNLGKKILLRQSPESAFLKYFFLFLLDFNSCTCTNISSKSQMNGT